MIPITKAPVVSTKPEAGVIATKPATAPVHIPTTEGFPCILQSIIAHVKAAIAEAICVTRKALAAKPSAAKPLPALNPNQPNHNKTCSDNYMRNIMGFANHTLFNNFTFPNH